MKSSKEIEKARRVMLILIGCGLFLITFLVAMIANDKHEDWLVTGAAIAWWIWIILLLAYVHGKILK